MTELAILLDSGVLVRDSGWRCVADVMRSHRNFIPAGERAHGVLVDAATLVQVYPPIDGDPCLGSRATVTHSVSAQSQRKEERQE